MHDGHVRWLRVVFGSGFCRRRGFPRRDAVVLVLALEIMAEEARPLGLTINWSKTKIQTMLDPAPASNQVTIIATVEVVESFPYLGSMIHCTGDSAPEIKLRVSITRDCMMRLYGLDTTGYRNAENTEPGRKCTSCRNAQEVKDR